MTANPAEGISNPKITTLTRPRWYVVACLSVLQSQIIAMIRQKIKSEHLTDMVLEIKEVKKKIRSSKTKKVEDRSVYPGYIFLKMILNTDIYNFIRSINGVKKFLGLANQPTPLSQREVTRFIDRITKDEAPTASSALIDFKEGDFVKIIASNLQGRECQVIKMNHATKTVTVRLEMFGRMVATDLNFNDCEKIC